MSLFDVLLLMLRDLPGMWAFGLLIVAALAVPRVAGRLDPVAPLRQQETARRAAIRATLRAVDCGFIAVPRLYRTATNTS